MKEKLLTLLNLKPDATDDKIVAAVEAQLAKNVGLEEQIKSLESKIVALPTEPKVDKRVREKMAAGLTFQQAVEVLASQDQADKLAKAEAKAESKAAK